MLIDTQLLCMVHLCLQEARFPKFKEIFYPKLYIFNTPVQKEGNLPGFHIHTICNLLLGHSSELKVILNQIRFVYFSAV